MKDLVGLMARLPRELHAELKQLGEQEDRSMNSMLILLVRLGLEAWRARAAASAAAHGPLLPPPPLPLRARRTPKAPPAPK